MRVALIFTWALAACGASQKTVDDAYKAEIATCASASKSRVEAVECCKAVKRSHNLDPEVGCGR